jgi:hypothetical protein
MRIRCTVAISPVGDFFLGDVQGSLTKQPGMARVAHFSGL